MHTRTLREALRVVKPGGKLAVVDYHRPGSWHPLRYLFEPVLRALEPYAMDLWKHEISERLPGGFPADHIHKRIYYGRLYQELSITVPARTCPMHARHWPRLAGAQLAGAQRLPACS